MNEDNETINNNRFKHQGRSFKTTANMKCQGLKNPMPTCPRHLVQGSAVPKIAGNAYSFSF
jgi:hypothetical protein